MKPLVDALHARDWLTYGPLFRDLHLLFDEFAKEVLAGIDHLGERIHMTSQDLPAHLFEAIDLAGASAARPHSTMRDVSNHRALKE